MHASHIDEDCLQMDPAGKNIEGNWPVYLQTLLQSVTAAAQSPSQVQLAGQTGHLNPSPTISVQHLQQVCYLIVWM